VGDVANVVEEFGEDGFLRRQWVLPPTAVASLRPHVEMDDDEVWIVGEWPLTEELAAVVQPWVDQPIDVASGNWFVSAHPT